MFVVCCFVVFLFKQKTAYEMRSSDWSSDVCSSDLDDLSGARIDQALFEFRCRRNHVRGAAFEFGGGELHLVDGGRRRLDVGHGAVQCAELVLRRACGSGGGAVGDQRFVVGVERLQFGDQLVSVDLCVAAAVQYALGDWKQAV